MALEELRSRPSLSAYLLGALVALFYLVGRWTPGRLLSPRLQGSPKEGEPRLWLALLALGLVLYLATERGRGRGLSRSWPRILGFLGLVALGLYFVASLAWAPSLSLAEEKAYELVLPVPLLVCIWMHRDPLGVARASIVVLTWLLLAMGTLAFFSSMEGRLAVLGGGPIVFGRNMGLLAVILLAQGMVMTRQVWRVALSLLAVMLVLVSGSRGALLAMLFGSGSLALRTRVWRLVPPLIVAAGTLVLIQDLPFVKAAQDRFAYRVLELTIRERYTAGRTTLYLESVDVFMGAPAFGLGLGGSGYALGAYPHNIFLEIACEGGLLAVALFLVFLCSVLWECRSTRAPPDLVGVFLVLLASAQFSGDLFDSRGVFLFGALILAAGASRRRRRSNAGAA